MTNKTCGECRFHNTEYDRHGRGKCYYTDNWYLPSCGACKAFKEAYHAGTLTNGDRIRQMDNAETAEFFGFAVLICPPIRGRKPDNCPDGCKECWLNWLNAPAESEGEK